MRIREATGAVRQAALSRAGTSAIVAAGEGGRACSVRLAWPGGQQWEPEVPDVTLAALSADGHLPAACAAARRATGTRNGEHDT